MSHFKYQSSENLKPKPDAAIVIQKESKCFWFRSVKIIPVPVMPIQDVSLSTAIVSPKPSDLTSLGDAIKSKNYYVLIIEDTDLAAKILMGSLKQALGVEGNRGYKKSGLNGSFYRCVSPADVEALMSDENMKDRFAFIILDNDLGDGGEDFGKKNAEKLNKRFDCPIIFNSSDFNRSRTLSDAEAPYLERDERLGYVEGVFESVEKKGDVLPILEKNIDYFINDLERRVSV